MSPGCTCSGPGSVSAERAPPRSTPASSACHGAAAPTSTPLPQSQAPAELPRSRARSRPLLCGVSSPTPRRNPEARLGPALHCVSFWPASAYQAPAVCRRWPCQALARGPREPAGKGLTSRCCVPSPLLPGCRASVPTPEPASSWAAGRAHCQPRLCSRRGHGMEPRGGWGRAQGLSSQRVQPVGSTQPRPGDGRKNALPVSLQVARSPLPEFDKEKAWRAVVVQMAQ